MKPETETTTPTPAVIGVDIGKEIFHVVAFGVDGKIAFRRKIRRLGRSMRTGRARSGARAARSGMPRCAKTRPSALEALKIDGEPVLRGSLN